MRIDIIKTGKDRRKTFYAGTSMTVQAEEGRRLIAAGLAQEHGASEVRETETPATAKKKTTTASDEPAKGI